LTSQRFQVLLAPAELQEPKRMARRQGVTVAARVREAIRHATLVSHG
jgi:hypothetical protein